MEKFVVSLVLAGLAVSAVAQTVTSVATASVSSSDTTPPLGDVSGVTIQPSSPATASPPFSSSLSVDTATSGTGGASETSSIFTSSRLSVTELFSSASAVAEASGGTTQSTTSVTGSAEGLRSESESATSGTDLSYVIGITSQSIFDSSTQTSARATHVSEDSPSSSIFSSSDSDVFGTAMTETLELTSSRYSETRVFSSTSEIGTDSDSAVIISIDALASSSVDVQPTASSQAVAGSTSPSVDSDVNYSGSSGVSDASHLSTFSPSSLSVALSSSLTAASSVAASQTTDSFSVAVSDSVFVPSSVVRESLSPTSSSWSGLSSEGVHFESSPVSSLSLDSETVSIPVTDFGLASSGLETDGVFATQSIPVVPSTSVEVMLTQSVVLPSTSSLLPSSSWIEDDSTELAQSVLASSSSAITSGIIITTTSTLALSSSRVIDTHSSVAASQTTASMTDITPTTTTAVSQMTPTVTTAPPTVTPELPTNTSTTSTTTTKPKTEKPATQEARYLLTLTGDCHLILNNTEFFRQFLTGFHDLLVKQLRIPRDSYKLGEISCGSVRVYVTFLQVTMPEFDIMIQNVIRNGGPGLSVPVWIDGHFATFDLSKARHVPLAHDDSTYSIVTEVMDDVDIIVIIVACCVCGVLVAIGVAICAKECYRRKHAQSFNLLDVPHVNLKLEDFTLTRIPRPRTVYTQAAPETPASSTPKFQGLSSMDGDSGGSAVTNVSPGSSAITANSNGHARSSSNGLHPSDMHLRVQQHSDGIIVGVTSSSASSASSPNQSHQRQHDDHSSHSPSQSDVYVNSGTSSNRRGGGRARTRTPSGGDNCPVEGEYPASERLLGNRSLGDGEDGVMNPVFVDEREEGAAGGRGEAL